MTEEMEVYFDGPIATYLGPRRNTYWRWDGENEAIVWRDGGTLVFRNELVQILRAMNQDGRYSETCSLPEMNSLLLLIALSGSRFDDSYLVSMLQKLEVPFPLVGQLVTVLNEMREQIILVGEEVPRAEVVAHLCEEMDLYGPRSEERHQTIQMIETLQMGPQFSNEELIRDKNLVKDLSYLFNKVRRFVATSSSRLDQQLSDKRKTGVTDMPAPLEMAEDDKIAQAQTPQPDRSPWKLSRELLAEMSADEEFGHIAGAAQDLVGAISLPKRLGEKSEVPFGGFSDISNRGTLDKLMLTELAHDDLSLAMRVVNGEALYLRREAHPKEFQVQRHLLPDLGMRMWGLPRLIEGALFLALSADRQLTMPLKCWVPLGEPLGGHGSESLQPMTMCDRADMVAFMSVMDGKLDSLHLIDDMMAAIHAESDKSSHAEKSSSQMPLQHELILVNHQAQMEDPSYRQHLWRLLLDVPLDRRFKQIMLVTYHPPVKLSFGLLSSTGLKPLNTLQVDEDRFRKQVQPKRSRKTLEPSQPLRFLLKDPKPLRYPCKHISSIVRLADEALFCFTKDRRLMHWEMDRNLGPQELSAPPDTPLFKAMACELTEGGKAVVAVFGSLQDWSGWSLMIYLESGELEHEVDLDLPPDWQKRKLRSFAVVDDRLVAIFNHSAEAISLESGKPLLQSVDFPEYKYILNNQRFISVTRGCWLRLSFAGGSLRMKIMDQTSGHYFQALDIGELYLANPGAEKIQRLDDEAPINFNFVSNGYDVGQISLDGRRLILQSRTSSYDKRIIQIKSAKDVTVTGYYDDDPENHQWLHQRSLRAKLDGVAWASGRQGTEVAPGDPPTMKQPHLVLIARKSFLHVVMDNDRLVFISEDRVKDHMMKSRGFRDYDAGGYMGRRAKLSEALWQDVRFVLDNRGLLHIQNHAESTMDDEVTEMSLVLEQKYLSGWCNNHTTFGEVYFTGAQKYQKVTAEALAFLEGVVTYMLLTESNEGGQDE